MNAHTRQRARYFSLALVLLALAAWIVPSFFSAERYRRPVQTALERELHRPLKFSAVSFRLLPRPGFSIANAEIEEDPDFGSEPFARVERIECDLRWQSLWHARLEFARLQLESPSFNLVRNSRGEWNVGKLLRESGVDAPANRRTLAGNAVAGAALLLDIQDGRLNFKVGADKKPFALTELRARLEIDPAQHRVQFQMKASPVRSNLAIPTPGPVEAEGWWMPGRDLRGPVEATVRTRGALLYDWIPIVTGHNPEVYGVFDSDCRISGSLPDLIVEGTSRLTQLHRWEELPPSDPMPWTLRFRGRLEGGLQRLVVESLDAGFANSHLQVSGTVDDLQESPQLDLVLALERSRLEDVLVAIRRWWPGSSSWGLKGRVDGIVAVQGPWRQRRYGGFVGAREVSLSTGSGSFPVSEIALRINDREAHLAPVQVMLTPRVALVAEGSIEGTGWPTRYDLQFSARNLPLHDALCLGRGLGLQILPGLDATGSATTSLHLTGIASPGERPVLSGRAELRAARLLIPGLTEPLNLPRATLQFNGDQITADPVVAVLGTSVFTAKLQHRGARSLPWNFDIHASALSLEQAALWFDALGHRQPLPLLERLPGLASLSARHSAASQLFGSVNAEGRFTSPTVTYRGVTLRDFQGRFGIAGRVVRMPDARFRAGGGQGKGGANVDFTTDPIHVSAHAAIAGISALALTGRLPAGLQISRGSVDAIGQFETHGWGRDELTENLAGTATLHSKDLSFSDFDLLDSLTRQAGWGTLEPLRGPLTIHSGAMALEVHDRRVAVKNAVFELKRCYTQIGGHLRRGREAQPRGAR